MPAGIGVVFELTALHGPIELHEAAGATHKQMVLQIDDKDEQVTPLVVALVARTLAVAPPMK